MRTLVVVDMQPSFEAAKNAKTIKQVVKLTKEAVSTGNRVVVLEYENYGSTHKKILDLLNPDFCKVIKKSADGGHFHVAAAIQDFNGFDGMGNPKNYTIDVCGVNLNACVRQTALGLKKLGFEVNVIKEACNQPSWWDSAEAAHKTLIENGVNVL